LSRRGAVVAASVALLAGCGSAVTKQDVVVRADAICGGAVRALRALTPVTSGAGLAAYLDRVTAIVASEASQLRRLPRPAQDRALLTRYIDSAGQIATEFEALASAARTGDSAAIATATSALRTNPAPVLAARYGLRDCAGAAATVGSG
jgi:hypothetical protein